MRIISGKYGRRRLTPPRGLTLRPTTDIAKEAIFNSLAAQYDLEGIRVLDLFAGIGSISLEFASRGAYEIISVEKNSQHARYIKEAANELDPTLLRNRILTVITRPAERYLAQYEGAPFDIIYADPPYDLPWLDEIPARVIASSCWGTETHFILEHPDKKHFEEHPYFQDHRSYSAVHFSHFAQPKQAE